MTVVQNSFQMDVLREEMTFKSTKFLIKLKQTSAEHEMTFQASIQLLTRLRWCCGKKRQVSNR